jgi:membrane carboxypeptidase/penicillin-binding protein
MPELTGENKTMTPEPAKVHKPARADYRTDQVRRYMRRHGQTAMFVNDGTEVSLTLDELGAFTCKEIRTYFNAARKRGFNE